MLKQGLQEDQCHLKLQINSVIGHRGFGLPDIRHFPVVLPLWKMPIAGQYVEDEDGGLRIKE